MNRLAEPTETESLSARLTTRGDLTRFFMQITAEISADAYLLLAVVHRDERIDARIVCSNWVFDAIELAGLRLIASLAQNPFSAPPGSRPRGIVATEAPKLLTGEEARLLDVLGHAEIFSLRLHVGRQQLFVLFSSTEAGKIYQPLLTGAQMRCCYALSQVPGMLAAAALQDPLSDRERECLFWVSEGKTTDEIGVILGVSSNTVNSYVTHAMQKLAASNRSAAIATAIRSGII